MAPAFPAGVRAQGPILTVRTAACEAVISALGAQVLAWRPTGGAEALWLTPTPAPGAPLRGGVPLCFPWFGAGPPGQPSHGFARTTTWALAAVEPDGDDVVARYTLGDDAATRARWPHAFTATLTATFGRALGVAFEVHNPGERPLRCEVALHGYLRVAEVTAVRVRGLGGVRWVDKTRPAAPPPPPRPDVWGLAGEVDAVHPGATGAVTVEDPAGGRALATTVVWNPGPARASAMPDVGPEEWRAFVCVEAANVGEDALVVPAGGRARTAQRLVVSAL